MKCLAIIFNSSEGKYCAQFAKSLGIEFDVVSFSGSVEDGFGAQKVSVVSGQDCLSDSAADFIAKNAGDYKYIFAVSSMASKDVLARAAGLCDAPMITDVVATLSPSQFKRPILAGAAIATVSVDAPLLILTFRPAGYQSIEVRNSEVIPSEVQLDSASKMTVISKAARSGARPDLSRANAVVSGGKPLKDAATFELIIGGLADKLRGAVGATRAAVDSGIAANELQVGQTGKIVAPDLYIAAGISGSTQHVAGIKDSKIIVAINKDPDAPIFDVADFGLVADLFQAVPELTSKLP